jgi:hypothetical protein
MLVLVASDGVALPVPQRIDVERRLRATGDHWRGWVQRTSYDGPWKDAVERSLLAIRLLADGRSGATAAAGTSSLPEVIGGERNYDYRFAWVRDASFTVDALLRVGMRELAHASVTWLLGAVARTHPRVDPVYALTGDVIRSQSSLDLPGYRGTSPVHVGNQAGSQLQLGGFGDLLETVWRCAGSGHVLSPQTGEGLATAPISCARSGVTRMRVCGSSTTMPSTRPRRSAAGPHSSACSISSATSRCPRGMWIAGAQSAIGSATSSSGTCGRTRGKAM